MLRANESGVVILKTFPNTAASEMGLQENDRILSINGKKTETIASLTEIIQKYKVGDPVVVKYERNGVSQIATSILSAPTESHYLNSRKSYKSHYTNYNNYQKENACEELEKMYGKPFLGVYLSNPYEEGGDGAKLTSIIKGTGAEAAVLQAADKITKMEQTPISSTKEAMQFIQSKQPGDQITIQVVRENKTVIDEAIYFDPKDNIVERSTSSKGTDDSKEKKLNYYR